MALGKTTPKRKCKIGWGNKTRKLGGPKDILNRIKRQHSAQSNFYVGVTTKAQEATGRKGVGKEKMDREKNGMSEKSENGVVNTCKGI